MDSKKDQGKKIRIGIVGYGNVGKGVELAVKLNSDMVLGGIFTRREPEALQKYSNAQILHISELENYRNLIDVAVLCGGSATDLPEQGPLFSSMFNTVDSFDTHAEIPNYFDKINETARQAGKTSVIATGWDPGLFSILRVFSESVLPVGKSYTFWGLGVSQGHSNAVRSVKGVKNAVQYTVPIEKAIKQVRNGMTPTLTSREMHRRICYVVPETGAEHERIKNQIVSMPNYFAPYDTEVHFISEKEFVEKHSKMPHGGFVLRSGITGEHNKELIDFSLKLDSNPEFTGNIMIAYARAAFRLNREGEYGAKTVFDIAPRYLSIRPKEELLSKML